MLWTWIGIAALVVFVMLIVNKRAVLNVFGLARAQAGKLADAVQQVDPIAQMNQSVRDAEAELRGFKVALTQCEALKTSLSRQVEDGKRQKNRLTAKIENLMAEGKTDADPVLQATAKLLADTNKSLETNTAQLEGNIKLYDNTLKKVQVAVGKIAAADQRAKTLKVNLQTSDAQSALNNMFAKFDSTNLNSSLGEISKYEQIVQQKIDQNNASLKVTEDLGGTTLQMDEDESNADAQDLLASIRRKREKPAAEQEPVPAAQG